MLTTVATFVFSLCSKCTHKTELHDMSIKLGSVIHQLHCTVMDKMKLGNLEKQKFCLILVSKAILHWAVNETAYWNLTGCWLCFVNNHKGKYVRVILVKSRHIGKCLQTMEPVMSAWWNFRVRNWKLDLIFWIVYESKAKSLDIYFSFQCGTTCFVVEKYVKKCGMCACVCENVSNWEWLLPNKKIKQVFLCVGMLLAGGNTQHYFTLRTDWKCLFAIFSELKLTHCCIWKLSTGLREGVDF